MTASDGTGQAGTVADAQLALAQAQARKAEAEARKADAEARSAELQAAAAAAPPTPDPTKAATDAKAERDTLAARAGTVSQFLPDLSKIDTGSLNVADGPALFGSVLTYRALDDAAGAVVNQLNTTGAAAPSGATRGHPDGTAKLRVLITAQDDLATLDATYQQVSAGMVQLTDLTTKLLRTLHLAYPQVPVGDAVKVAAVDDQTSTRSLAGAVAVAVASMLPAVISLFAVQRTVRSAAVTVGDLAAGAAVAGRLASTGRWAVLHDTFRTSPASGPLHDLTALSALRSQLLPFALTLADRKIRVDADLTAAKAASAGLLADIAKAGTEPNAQQQSQLKVLEDTITGKSVETEELARASGLVEKLGTAVDTFVTVVQTVPASGARSPITTAGLYAALHSTEANRIDRVLLVRAGLAQTEQVVSDRKLSNDSFSTLAEAAITYLLLDPVSGEVLVAGTRSATAQAHGEIGSELKLTARHHRAGTVEDATDGDGAADMADQLAADGLPRS